MKLFLSALFIFACWKSSFAETSIGYSGRLVKSNGQPVAGNVKLRFDLHYSNNVSDGGLYCYVELDSVPLANGVYNVELDFDAGAGACVPDFHTVLSSVPPGEKLVIRVHDLTNDITFDWQEILQVPYAFKSKYAENASSSSVRSALSASTPLVYSSSSGNFSIPQANGGSDGYLSSDDWTVFNSKENALGYTPVDKAGDSMSGNLDLTGNNLLNAGQVNIKDGDTNYVELKTPADLAANYILTLPSGDGDSGQVLTSDGGGILSWTSPVDTARGSLSAMAPLGYNSSTGAFSITQSNSSTDGYLSSADWSTFTNDRLNKAGDLMSGDLDMGGNNLLNIGLARLRDSDTNYVELKSPANLAADYILTFPSGDGDSGQVLTSDGAGILSWTTPVDTARGSLSASPPLVYNSSTGDFSIPQANGSSNGFLSSGDWSTFTNDRLNKAGDLMSGALDMGGNNLVNIGLARLKDVDTNYVELKTPANLAADYILTLPVDDGASGQVLTSDGAGVLSWTTPVDTARGSLSASAPLNYNNSTGNFSISLASNLTNGYLSSTDWTTFNNKQNALGYTPVDKAGDAMTGNLSAPVITGTTSIRPATLLDTDGTNFFDGGCGDNSHITGISSNGAITCAADSGDISGVSAGTGLTGGGSSGSVTINADTTYLQRRVGSSCAAGSSIRVINADGTVACEVDTDTNTTYSAGAGLTLSGTTFSNSYDHSGLQSRVSGSCLAGSSIRVINADGTVTCETDNDTIGPWSDNGSHTYHSGSGNVGIGVTGPTRKLEVLGGDGEGAMAKFGRGGLEKPLYFSSTNNANFNISTEGALKLRVGVIPDLPYSTGLDGLTILREGNVGIGTTAPKKTLHVKAAHGKILMTDDNVTEAGNQSLLFQAIATNPAIWEIAATDPSGTNSTKTQYITMRSGNVGIGGSSPGQKLDVVGNIRTSGCLYYNASSLGTCASDKRVKKDIRPFNLGLDELLGINPVHFKYNGLGGLPADGIEQVGVIAQDVEKAAPSLVVEKKVKLNPEDEEDTSIKAVDYGSFTYMVINSIKQLHGKIVEIMHISKNNESELKAQQRDIASIQEAQWEKDARVFELEEENAELKAQNDAIIETLCEIRPESKICNR